MKKVVIGYSDYSRNQIEENDCYGAFGSTTRSSFLRIIKQYENNNYTVVFKTSLFRKIFLQATYKVIAYKN